MVTLKTQSPTGFRANEVRSLERSDIYKGEGKGGPNPRKGGVRDKALTPPFSNVPGNGHSVRQTNPPNDTKFTLY
jgi:hypothetical protein